LPWPVRLLDAASRRPRPVVAAAAVLPFLGTLRNAPVLDDGWAVLDNPLVRGGLAAAGRILTEPYGVAGGASLQGPFRPLTTLSFAASYALHGRAGPGWHLVNLALHAAASLLVLALARRLAAAAGRADAARVALLAAVLFAVHPVHVEAIAPIVGRSELLAAALALGALLLALDRPRPGRVAAAAGLLALAILSKEGAVVTPGLFLLVALVLPAAAGLDARPGLAPGPPRRALARAGGAAAALALAVLPYLALRGFEVAAPPAARWFGAAPAGQVALSATRVLAEYLRVLFVPTTLGTDFAYAARIPLLAAPDAHAVVATAAWLAVLGGALAAARRAPLAAAGLLWIFVALLPVLHLVPIGTLMAERLAYLPSVGACLAAAAALAALPARAGAVLAAALSLLLAGRAAARAHEWRSPRALWEAEVALAPRDPVVNNNLAVELSRAGEHAAAVPRLEAALAAAPGYWRAHVNLGIAWQGLGDRAGARQAFLTARALAPREPEPLRFLAWLDEAEGRGAAAAEALAEARRLAPEASALAREHGALLLRLGRRDEGRAALREALRLDPKDGWALRLLQEAR
jgi:Flp pilus assembly protein TadD